MAEFNNFIDFVTTPPLAGLGESLDTLKRLCRDDPSALDAIDRVTVRHGGDHGNQYASGKDDNVMLATVPCN